MASDQERDLDLKPYSADEFRVASWLCEKTGIGGGNDPIGFLLISYEALSDNLAARVEATQEASFSAATMAVLTKFEKACDAGVITDVDGVRDYIRTMVFPKPNLGPTPAFDAAIKAAEVRGMERAAVIAETHRDGNPSAIAGTAWWGTQVAAAIRAAAGGGE